MGGRDVGLGEGEVAFDHLEAGVAEECLQGKDIAAVAQVVEGKGMAEAVRVNPGFACSSAEAVEMCA